VTVVLSIIIPTYNESQNILQLIDAIRSHLKTTTNIELVVVDDNSPDGTGKLVEEYATSSSVSTIIDGSIAMPCAGKNYENNDREIHDSEKNYLIKVIKRANNRGLISAILEGVRASRGKYVLVMDGDFSHSPEIIPEMLHEIENSGYDIVIGSRYTKGGSTDGWPFRRRLISKGATKLAQYGLKIKIKDPMSGFFVCKREVIEDLEIDTFGFKILLEILVKKRGIKVKEIPYTFVNRKLGESKMDLKVISNYLKAVWILYRYGWKSRQAFQLKNIGKSISFFSKAARFYTVGGSGLLVNYFISSLLANGLQTNISYMNATLIGIICSITSNFLLNKRWTFEDNDFSLRHTLKQYGKFGAISSLGAAVQLVIVYTLTDSGFTYGLSLLPAVAIASISNFLLNKKWTFQERIWS
jgi:dolichol-phosphate mannosyltransferase